MLVVSLQGFQERAESESDPDKKAMLDKTLVRGW